MSVQIGVQLNLDKIYTEKDINIAICKTIEYFSFNQDSALNADIVINEDKLVCDPASNAEFNPDFWSLFINQLRILNSDSQIIKILLPKLKFNL